LDSSCSSEAKRTIQKMGYNDRTEEGAAVIVCVCGCGRKIKRESRIR